MSIVLYGCDICKTTFKMGKYTGGDCPECGQEYLYDECISIRLTSKQREMLRRAWCKERLGEPPV